MHCTTGCIDDQSIKKFGGPFLRLLVPGVSSYMPYKIDCCCVMLPSVYYDCNLDLHKSFVVSVLRFC